MSFSRDALRIDARQETERIVAFLRESVRKQMRRHGVVVGISGGVDSAAFMSPARTTEMTHITTTARVAKNTALFIKILLCIFTLYRVEAFPDIV